MSYREAFEQELKRLSVLYPDRSTFDAAYAFISVHLPFAEAAVKLEPQLAIEQYRLAEECQGTIGTYSTGSGDGLASMMDLYDIMAKRAELEEQVADTCEEPGLKKKHLEEAIRLWVAIKSDPNLGELLPKKDMSVLLAKAAAFHSHLSP